MRYIFSLTLLLLCCIISAQKLTYEVVLFGKVIGTTTVYRTEEKNGGTRYLLQGSSTATVLFVHRRSSQNYVATYQNQQLKSAYTTNVVDDEVTEVSTDWDGHLYHLKKNKREMVIAEHIIASTLMLYFNEPTETRRYFSERLGEFYLISKNADGTYEYTLSDNIRTIFRYKDGWIQQMDMKKNFVTVTLRLVRIEPN